MIPCPPVMASRRVAWQHLPSNTLCWLTVQGPGQAGLFQPTLPIHGFVSFSPITLLHYISPLPCLSLMEIYTSSSLSVDGMVSQFDDDIDTTDWISIGHINILHQITRLKSRLVSLETLAGTGFYNPSRTIDKFVSVCHHFSGCAFS